MPTKRYKGAPLDVTFTQTFPTSATAITITGVKSGKFDRGISQKMESGDADGFHSVAFNDHQNPTQSFETIDAYAGAAIAPGVRGTVAYKHADVYGGVEVAGGGKQVTITNAFLMGDNIDAVYRDFGKNSMTFACISPDGSTHPVTIAAL